MSYIISNKHLSNIFRCNKLFLVEASSIFSETSFEEYIFTLELSPSKRALLGLDKFQFAMGDYSVNPEMKKKKKRETKTPKTVEVRKQGAEAPPGGPSVPPSEPQLAAGTISYPSSEGDCGNLPQATTALNSASSTLSTTADAEDDRMKKLKTAYESMVEECARLREEVNKFRLQQAERYQH